MDSDLKKLLEKNLEISEKIYKNTKYLKRHVFYSQIFSFIKIFIIIAPLVWGYFYLQPILAQMIAQYQSIMNLGNSASQLNPANFDLSSINLDAISPDILNMLKK